MIPTNDPHAPMKPTELPAHLWPACRRVMLRQAAAMARDLVDLADDLDLNVARARIEHVEHAALGELAAGIDTIENAAGDLRSLPPELSAGRRERAAVGAQLRQMSLMMRVAATRQRIRPVVENAWESLARQLMVFMASAPPP
jgi:hypothetical protein